MYEYQDKQYSRILRLSIMILAVSCFALWQQIDRVTEFVDLVSERRVQLALWVFVPIACLILMVSAVLVVLAKSVAEMKHIRELAFMDELTGLPNRRQFTSELEQEVVSSIRSGDHISVMYFDIDRFKVINDCHGREIGDALIRQFGQRLNKIMRNNDFVARLSGDEFAAIVRDVRSDSQIENLAERVFSLVKEPFIIDDKRLYAGVSIGAVVITDPTVDAVEALNRADFALLDAKERGRNQLSMFDPAMARSIKERNQLEIDLREAVDNQQLEMRYHPLIDVKSTRIIGVEALVRWSHPTKGMISPAEFIPLAEEIGIIDKLGEFVMRQACTDIAPREGIKLAVNVSPMQFMQQGFVEKVQRILLETKFSPERLELEITEGVLIANPKDTAELLGQLRDIGVHIALDDFGTGFSSMAYLRNYPLDRIKIDKSFVADMKSEDENFSFLSKMIELGGSLGMDVTVEGIETTDQLDLLKKSKANEIQGFLFSKPMTAKELQSCDLVQAAKAAMKADKIRSQQAQKNEKKRKKPSLKLVG